MAGVLGRLASQTVPPRRVLVVDNGGTIQGEDLAAMPLHDLTTLISLPENPGYGAAVNAARPLLGESALLVLTHDAVFGAGLAASLLTALAKNEGCAAPLLHFAEQPDRVFSAGGRLSRGGRAFSYRTPISRTPYQVAWVDGAIVMYTALALDRIGWLSEEYFLYFEDVDTGWRLARAGLSCLVVPSEIAYQQPGAHPMYLGIRNMALFSRKAGIPAPRSFAATAYRVAQETYGNLKRRRPLLLADAWRGWRDGRARISGKPAT